MSLQNDKWFVSLRVKIWIGFILIFTPVFVICFWWFDQFTSSKVLQIIEDNLTYTVDATVAKIDIQGFTQLAEESTKNPSCLISDSTHNGYYPEDNPLYIQHENWLYTVQNIQSNTRIYTYIKGSKPGEIIAIGSTGYFRTPRGGFKFCERYTSTTSKIYDGLNGRVNVWTPYSDNYGIWITTYTPIKDSQGHIIGALGVDIPALYVKQARDEIKTSGTIAFCISYALIFVLVYLMAGIMTKPIITLSHLSGDIAEGDYHQNWESVLVNRPLKDEIDALTVVFKSMVEKVAEREENLRARVQQLEILIDQSKRDNQVQEIVDSSFFQELQGKVKKMRTRFAASDKSNKEE